MTFLQQVAVMDRRIEEDALAACREHYAAIAAESARFRAADEDAFTQRMTKVVAEAVVAQREAQR